MAKKKKSRKMDPKLVSKETHEIAYLSKKLGVTRKVIRLARKQAGRGRVRVTAFVKGYLAFGAEKFGELDYSNASEP